jgi:hypothetical protein
MCFRAHETVQWQSIEDFITWLIEAQPDSFIQRLRVPIRSPSCISIRPLGPRQFPLETSLVDAAPSLIRYQGPRELAGQTFLYPWPISYAQGVLAMKICPRRSSRMRVAPRRTLHSRLSAVEKLAVAWVCGRDSGVREEEEEEGGVTSIASRASGKLWARIRPFPEKPLPIVVGRLLKTQLCSAERNGG